MVPLDVSSQPGAKSSQTPGSALFVDVDPAPPYDGPSNDVRKDNSLVDCPAKASGDCDHLVAEKSMGLESENSTGRKRPSSGDPVRTSEPVPSRYSVAGIAQRAEMCPALISPAEIRLLQRTIGNQAVGQLLRRATERKTAPLQRSLLLGTHDGVVQRDPDDPNRSTDPKQSVGPNAGPNQSTDPLSDLGQAYSAAVAAGDWQAAAEKLNGFNREDILSRLATLTPDQIAKIHQGALDNPRVGSGSQVAQVTDAVVAAVPSVPTEAAPAGAEGRLAGAGLLGIGIPTPGTPGLPPGLPPGGPGPFPGIPGETPFNPGFGSSAAGAGGGAAEGTAVGAGAAEGTAVTTGVAEGTAVGVGAAEGTAAGAGGIGLGTLAVAVVLGIPVAIAIVAGAALISSGERSANDPNTPTELPEGGAPPIQAPGQGTPAPAIDPITGQPISVPSQPGLTPAVDPTTDDPAVLPGAPNAGPVQVSSASIANGHAYDKHVIKQGEFPEIPNPVADRPAGIAQFQKIIDRVMGSAENKALSNGRHAFWEDATGTLVITNPKDADGGTCFRPSAGKSFYDKLK